MTPFIQTFIPYADDRNYGRACNQAMSLLPEDGWGCIIDHDVLFTTSEWHRQLSTAVDLEPDGCFSAMTNRIKCPFQRAPSDPKNHDYAYHRIIGRIRFENYPDLLDVTDAEKNRTPAGFLMLMSKQAWCEAGGFPEGLHYVDRMMWLALKASGRRIYIIQGLYLYHYHRGANEPIQRGEWVVEHQVPGGKKLKLLKKREELPVYTG